MANLEDTLRQLKASNEENFLPLVEKMKRKASKGMIEASPEEIDALVKKIQSENSSETVDLTEQEELISMISETSQALFEYEKHQEEKLEKLSESELESLAIQYMKSEILNESEAVKDDSYEYYDTSDDEEEKRKQKNKNRAKLIAGTTVGAGAGAASMALTKPTLKNAAKKTGSLLLAAKNKIVGGAKWALKANPVATGIGAGLAAGAAIYGIAKLIKHIRKKRKEKQVQNLTEEFSPELIEATQYWLSVIDESVFYELYDDEDMAALFNEAISQLDLSDDSSILDEELEFDTKTLEEEAFNKPLFELLSLEG